MLHETMLSILLATLLLQANGIDGKKAKKPVLSLNDAAGKRGLGNFKLPDLSKLTTEEIPEGTRYTYEGCVIDVQKDMSVIKLKLTDKKCQDVMSIPRIFEKITGKDMKGSKLFAPFEKFNVDFINVDQTTKDVSIQATAKEAFQLVPGTSIKVQKAKAMVDFNYGKFDDFERLGFDIEGQVMIKAVDLSVSLVKLANSKEGRFNIHAGTISVADFYGAFTKQKELDENSKASTSVLSSVALVNPNIAGVRDKKGNSEIVVTATATEIPGMGQGAFFVVVKVADGKPAEVGVVVKLNEVKPSDIIFKLTSLDLKGVPIINDLQLDIVIEYANEDIGLPKDKELTKVLKDFSQYAMIEKGTKLKFLVPFKELIAKNGVEVPADTNLDQYVNIIIKEGTVDFEFDEDAPMDLLNILVAFIPKFGEAAFQKMFQKSPKVKFSTFKVDVRTFKINIVLETLEPIPLGVNFLTLLGAKFQLKHEQTWDFEFSSDLKIGDGLLKLKVKKQKDTFELSGSVDAVTTADLVSNFKVDSRAAEMMKKLKGLNFALTDVTISAVVSEKLNLKVLGTAVFGTWSARFEGYIIDTKEGPRALAFGLSITNVGMNSVADSLFNKNGNKIGLLDAEWMSKVTMAITAANEASKDEITFTAPQLVETTKSDGKALGKPKDGVRFYVKIEIPKDCKQETICEFVKKKIGAGQMLTLEGAVTSSGFSLLAGFDGNIELGKKFALKSAGLKVYADIKQGTARVEIKGDIQLKLKDSNVDFSAIIGVSPSGQVVLSLTIDGIWENAFGFKNIHFGNFQMDCGFSFTTLLPTFMITGEFHFGNGVDTVKAELSGGFETDGVTPKYHMYAKFNKLSIQAILDAFNSDLEVPKAIANSGFPKGLVAGFSFPKGKDISMTILSHKQVPVLHLKYYSRMLLVIHGHSLAKFDSNSGKDIQALGVKLKPGFFLYGTLDILGYEIMCDLEVDLPKKFRLVAEFGKLNLAGGAIILSSVDKKSGPTLEINIGLKALKIEINAYVEVLRIGIGAKISISNAGMRFEVVGKFLDLFEASLIITAPYGSLKDLPGSAWKVESCISEYVMDKIKDGATGIVSDATNATQIAQEDSNKRLKNAGSWVSKSNDKVEYWKKKLLAKEEKFKEKIAKLERKKKDMDQKCVLKCEKKRIWVGGFGEKTCVVAGKQVKCPYWIEEKHMRDDPYCLSKCESSKFNIIGRMKGAYKEGKLTGMEEKMEFYAKMLSRVESFFRSSQSLIEHAEQASKKVREIQAAGAEAFAKVRQFTANKLLYIKKVCIQSSMEKASKGLCFSIDADIYIGGKSGKHIELKNEEGCFNMDFAKDIGMKIAQKAFPGIEKIKDTFGQVQNLWGKIDNDGKDAEKKSKEVDEEEKNEQKAIKKTRLAHYRTDEIMNSFPEIVVRNDESMMAFRDLFDNDDESVTQSTEIVDRDDIALADRMKFDTASLSNSAEAHKCKRAHAVATAYADIADSMNYMMDKNKKLKSNYEEFIKDYETKFIDLGKQVLNETITNKMSPEDTENAMFYITKAKAGINKWKKRYAAQFDIVDKSSLTRWRHLMSEVTVDSGTDIASFVKIMKTASKETAKRMEIPRNHGGRSNDDDDNDDDYSEESLEKAENILDGLFEDGEHEEALSAKEEAMKILHKESKNMLRAAKQCKA